MEQAKIHPEHPAHLPALRATGKALFDAASNYLDQGIGVFLSDPATRRGLDRTSEFDPITDKEVLLNLCSQNQDANLEVVVDAADFNLFAIEIASDQDGAIPEPLDQLNDNDTLTIDYPDGTRYYLFRGKDTLPTIRSEGIRFLRNVDPILVPPSIISGRPVIRVSASNQIATIDVWLETIEKRKQGETPVTTTEDESTSTFDIEDEDEIDLGDSPDADFLIPHFDADPVMLDVFISEHLEAGETKEATYLAALAYRAEIGHEEPDTKVLDRVISIAAAKVTIETNLDYIYAYLQELAYFLMHLFVDEHDQPHAFLKDQGRIISMSDKTIARYLAYHRLRINGSMTKAKYIKDTLEMLEVKLRYEGEKITLSNRIAWEGGNIFFDMGDANSIKITAEGWNIERSPIHFRRFGHQLPQIKPVTGGDAWKLFDYLNVEEGDRLLVLVYIISLFIPDIAHPVLLAWGERGSAKSFFCAAVNALCDPTSVTKLVANRQENDLIQNLYKHYVAVFDNLSEISPQMSDILCQACTGTTFNKRRLYTDSDDITFKIKHAVILNSIEMLLVRQDLIDRSIILHMNRIPPNRRRPEIEVWKSFEADKPLILGGIIDCVCKAMKIFPTLPPMDLPRMADFYQWGYAITQALDLDGEDFVKAYASNIEQQNASVRHTNTLCGAVIELMESRELHESTVKVTLDELREIAEPKSSDQTFPKAPKDLVAHLKEIESSLEEYDVTFEVGRRQGRGTPLTIRKIANASPAASSASPDSLANPNVIETSETGVSSEAGAPSAATFTSDDLGWEDDDLIDNVKVEGAKQ